jgi:hypothetical protein
VANLIANPSFEVDTNADGLADNWAVYENAAGTPTASRVTGLFGSYAQRIEYTSSADTAKTCGMYSATSGVGTVSAGTAVSGVAWVRITHSGVTAIYTSLAILDSSGGAVATYAEAYVLTNIPQGVWVPYVISAPALPANSSQCRIYFYVSGIDTGDSVTLDVDGVYLSPDANFDHYGKYPVIGKGVRL